MHTKWESLIGCPCSVWTGSTSSVYNHRPSTLRESCQNCSFAWQSRLQCLASFWPMLLAGTENGYSSEYEYYHRRVGTLSCEIYHSGQTQTREANIWMCINLLSPPTTTYTQFVENRPPATTNLLHPIFGCMSTTNRGTADSWLA